MAEGEIPDAVDELVQQLGGIYVPKNASEEEAEIYQRALDGKCMTCGGDLGEHPYLLIGYLPDVTQLLVLMVMCSGACFTDMQVMGWLQQTHADISQQIEFRGGQGGN